VKLAPATWSGGIDSDCGRWLESRRGIGGNFNFKSVSEVPRCTTNEEVYLLTVSLGK
jgi:hypothetical protein